MQPTLTEDDLAQIRRVDTETLCRRNYPNYPEIDRVYSLCLNYFHTWRDHEQIACMTMCLPWTLEEADMENLQKPPDLVVKAKSIYPQTTQHFRSLLKEMMAHNDELFEIKTSLICESKRRILKKDREKEVMKDTGMTVEKHSDQNLSESGSNLEMLKLEPESEGESGKRAESGAEVEVDTQKFEPVTDCMCCF